MLIAATVKISATVLTITATSIPVAKAATVLELLPRQRPKEQRRDRYGVWKARVGDADRTLCVPIDPGGQSLAI